MTPEEFKKIALEASKSEYNQIMKVLEQEAQKGAFHCDVDHLTDGAQEQLTQEGFDVKSVNIPINSRGPYPSSKKVFRISFNKK